METSSNGASTYHEKLLEQILYCYKTRENTNLRKVLLKSHGELN